MLRQIGVKSVNELLVDLKPRIGENANLGFSKPMSEFELL